MAKCVNCAWFPWKPGADFSMLPVMKCHPETKARRWNKAGAETETGCKHYNAVKAAEDVVEDKVASVQIAPAAVEAPVEKKPKAQARAKSTKSAAKTKKAKPRAKSKTAKKE